MKILKKLIIILLIFSMVILIGNVNSYAVNSEVKIHYLSVGCSECILIENNGTYGLIDGAEGSKSYYNKYVANSTNFQIAKYIDDSSNKLNGLTNNLSTISYLKNIMGNKKLSFVIATHSHSDHIGGIPEIADANLVDSSTTYYYKPYVVSKEDQTNREKNSWKNELFYLVALEQMKKNGAKIVDVTKMSEGYQISLGNCRLKLYNLAKGTVNDSDENVNSIVVLMNANNKKALFTSDIERDMLDTIAKKVGKIDILKAAHHGGNENTTFKALDYLKPNYVVICNNVDSIKNNSIFNAPLIYLNEQKLLKGFYVTGKENNKSVITTISQSGNISIQSAGNKYSGNYSNLNLTLNSWYKAGKEYLYYTNNAIAYGFKDISYRNKMCTFYFNNKGIMQTGLQKINSKYYYFDENGVMQKSQTFTVDGKTYTFDSNGIGTLKTTQTTQTTQTTGKNSNPTTNTTKTSTLNNISIYTYPTKTTFNYQDKADFTGLTLRLNYSDGTKKYVSSGYTTNILQNQALTNAGYNKVTITYQGKTTYFYIKVNSKTSSTTNTSTRATSTLNTNLVATVSYSTKSQTSNPVTITIKANKELADNGSNWKYSSDKKSMSTTVSNNTKYLLVVHAKDGTTTSVDVQVNNIVSKTSTNKTTNTSTNTKNTTNTTKTTTTTQKNGWQMANGKYVYYKNGTKLLGLQKVGSDTYYFDNNGYMFIGWKILNGKTYYFDNAGHMKTKWLYTTLNGTKSWFYFESNGVMVYNTSKKIDGKTYYFDKNGRCTNPY